MFATKRKEIKPLPPITDELVIGRSYKILARNYGTERPENTERGSVNTPMKMELVDLYPNFARFRRKAGYTESFSYWDLARRLLHG